jgi:hypothetical protein
VDEILSPPPVDLAAERREHVFMYQLIGDPLLPLHGPRSKLHNEQQPPTK